MTAPLRVLHVVGTMNRGGIETMLMNLYRNIDTSKVQFDFIIHTDNYSDYEEEILSLGGNIYKFEPLNGLNIFNYIYRWKCFLQKNTGYKIIHGHVRSTATIYLLIAKIFGFKTIMHSHSISNGKGFKAKIKNIFQYPIRYISSYLFSCSDIAEEWLFGKKKKNRNYIRLPNAVDLELFKYNISLRNEMRDQLKVGNKFVIGHVGRFYEPKNHKFVIEIFEKVLVLKPDSLLLLIGDGPLKAEIKNVARNKNILENIIFIESTNDINKYYQAMDVFLFPSLYEGLGMVLIEAQTSGLNCYTSKNVVPPEVEVTDLLKFISLSKTAQEWANKIIFDNTNSNRIDMTNLVRSKGYDIKETSKFMEKFYQKVADKENV